MTARILLADDEAVIRLDLRETLERAGHVVAAEAASGREALDLAPGARPELAILDVRMPEPDGIAVAARLREAGVPSILLTAFGDRELIARAADAGVYVYLTKPFREAELLAAVETALRRDAERKELAGEARRYRGKWSGRGKVEQAKAVLRESYGLDEDAAFAVLRKRSMDEKLPIADIAEQVLDWARKRAK